MTVGRLSDALCVIVSPLTAKKLRPTAGDLASSSSSTHNRARNSDTEFLSGRVAKSPRTQPSNSTLEAAEMSRNSGSTLAKRQTRVELHLEDFVGELRKRDREKVAYADDL